MSKEENNTTKQHHQVIALYIHSALSCILSLSFPCSLLSPDLHRQTSIAKHHLVTSQPPASGTCPVPLLTVPLILSHYQRCFSPVASFVFFPLFRLDEALQWAALFKPATRAGNGSDFWRVNIHPHPSPASIGSTRHPFIHPPESNPSSTRG